MTRAWFRSDAGPGRARRGRNDQSGDGTEQGATGERPAGLISSINDRVEGYYEAMAQASIEVSPSWVHYAGAAGDSARAAVEANLNGENRPTGLLASNANMSLAVLRAVKARGLPSGRMFPSSASTMRRGLRSSPRA